MDKLPNKLLKDSVPLHLRLKNRAFLIALLVMIGVLYGLAIVRMKGIF
jgi:hypothetical protein